MLAALHHKTVGFSSKQVLTDCYLLPEVGVGAWKTSVVKSCGLEAET